MWQNRRQAITDDLIDTKGVSPRSLQQVTLRGTHAMGAASGYGTVTFPGAKFTGTPTVIVTPLAGSTAFGRTVQLGVRTRWSGSFSYRGSPSGGTFNWLAVGSSR